MKQPAPRHNGTHARTGKTTARSPWCWCTAAGMALGLLVGCQATPGPVFPPVSPPIVWPSPPDRPRIEYIGELRGEASLDRKPTGWEAFRRVITGPEPPVEFSRPSAVAVSPPRVYVADTGLGVVHVLNLDSREYIVSTGAESDAFQIPIDIVLDQTGLPIVIDRGRAAIDILDRDAAHQRTIRFEAIEAPVAAAWNDESRLAYIADATAHCVFSITDWEAPDKLYAGRGAGTGQFNFPSGIAWHPLCGVVVADAMNFRIQVFSPDKPPVSFGQRGDAAGDFARPRDVAVDSDGHIYVLDNQFENVQIFDGSGRLLMAFGRGGDGPGEFSLPSGITIDDQDRIWIADSYNRRVQVFQYLSEEVACAE